MSKQNTAQNTETVPVETAAPARTLTVRFYASDNQQPGRPVATGEIDSTDLPGMVIGVTVWPPSQRSSDLSVNFDANRGRAAVRVRPAFGIGENGAEIALRADDATGRQTAAVLPVLLKAAYLAWLADPTKGPQTITL